ncbi:sulfolipid-1 biosynthesis phthioceranic/hydroxyphthioceranic acid synthase [Mycolicibacterium sp.]|uniref:sulfolipid-1 biosynthesis phthioceranic/hydroxyphthioceranic acid synthase n=1 Tax=Mycolicibacterium sp. TaxID=2320850 RepID=UPI001A26A142|nr:sulfolipid-1 biosynthesis phthioceranic/hydroxyphthioceranic acid synthase [Mycolicibacterium sp.]MBJ7339977.1 type I polyketide synthase [Mycolicibacterium sp.]
MVTPIAVIGMACRLPGGIDSPEQLWDALLRGDDLVTDVPADRWDADEFYDSERGVPGRSVSRWGAFLDDMSGFDAAFFGLDDEQARAIDPQHRLLLETSWEAVEHAGIAPSSLSGSMTGVYLGLSHDDYMRISLEAGAYGFTGLASAMASGRVAYAMNLHGPAITVDTACSSGLLAVHTACRSLDGGESDLALAGGCMVILQPETTVWASGQGMMSPTGRCRAFDEAADGFVRSEGCAVVLLKRLPDALRDGDRILGVVRGTAANSDGRTRNIATPSQEAQAAAARAALTAAGVDADTIAVVEAHGTGTPVGDPIEFESLAQTYGATGEVLLGSAKSNFGHTESAAGTLGLIKAILELQHGLVPPMVHFNQLPESLARIDTKIVVPKEVTAWPTDGHPGPRRAAVSSYGISGTNVHAIVEQAPEADTAGPDVDDLPERAMLIPLSSSSADELRRTCGRLADWLDRCADPIVLADMGYTLARRRGHRTVRTSVIAGDVKEMSAALHDVAAGDTPFPAAVGRDDRGPVWVFSGQGSQWAGMGADLLQIEPVFADTVATIEPLIAHESGFSVTEAMSAPETVTGIGRVQPTLFAMQVALAATLASHGVRPGAVIGHSMGEVAAAVVAGSLSLQDGVRVICRRSTLLGRLSGSGAMASVDLPEATVRRELATLGIDDVVVAVVASPQTTVIGGDTRTVRELIAAWEQREVTAREVAVDVASHSPRVDPILADLAASLAELTPRSPAIPFYSSTRDDPRAAPACDADYWVANLRQTVRFSSAVQAALEDGHRVFTELSPHPLLTRAVEQTAHGMETPAAALASLRRDQPSPHGVLGIVSDVFSAGAAVDFSVPYPDGRLVDAPLPTWTHHRLLLARADAGGQGHHVAVHPLLGAHVRLLEEPERHAWQADVGTAARPWLADHRVHDVVALPGAVYCEMALAAADALFAGGAEVRDVHFDELLLLDDHTEVAAVASIERPGVASFAVQTDSGEGAGDRVRRAGADLYAVDDVRRPARRDVQDLLTAFPNTLGGEDIRQSLAARGIAFGPAFGGLIRVHTTADGATLLAEIAAPADIRAEQSGYGIHPAVLDACFQSVGAHLFVAGTREGGLLLPLSVGRLHSFGSGRNARYCHVCVTKSDAATIEANLEVLDGDGEVLLAVDGLRMGSGASKAGMRDRMLSDRLVTVEWEQREPPGIATIAGQWLLIAADTDPLAAELSDALVAGGARCRTAPPGDPLDPDGLTGVVVLAPPADVDPTDATLVRGRDLVSHVVHVARELSDIDARPPRLYVVTRNAQAVTHHDRIDLDHGGVRGLVRVIGAEQTQLRPTQIDVDAGTAADLVAQELLSSSDEDDTAWRDGSRYVARLRRSPLRADERRTALADPASDGMRLQVRNPGDLQTLELVAAERPIPTAGQVEVAVSASSINFADVLAAFGRYPTFDGKPPQLGLDFTGVISAVGPGVTEHRIGDEVGGFGAGGCWGTYVTCDARLVAPLPAGLSAEQAAAVSTGYGTAWYGLCDLARLAPGDRVLIHSATGGVGQAALAIARHIGAEIYATAGSPRRWQLLHEMGVDHVYDSRSTDFADQIRHDTDGYGVDVVLNSLTGPAQRAGLELLAFGGRFVEIGKRDVYEHTRVDLYPFRRNLTFYYADLALMTTGAPKAIGALLRKVYELVGDGVLPVPEHTVYPLTEAATAIRAISAAEHTGKLVLSVEKRESTRVAVPPNRAPVFRNDGSYLITGGVGGLGLFLAAVMASGGCGRIVLTSRSQPNPRAQKTIERLRANGTDIVVLCGNIADPETAARLVSAATATGLPLRGILHAAAVVDDATLGTITDDLVERDWAPKVNGAWHLHRAAAGQPLDWFCHFSSAAVLLGSPGQGAYSAANSWLDTFTTWQRRQGIAAYSIAWGAWADIGRGTGVADRGDVTMIRPEDGGYAFRAILRHDRPYTGYLPLTGMPLLTALAARSPFAEAFRDPDGQHGADVPTVLAELAGLAPDEWPNRLRRLVTEQVGLILRRAVDPDRSFADHGLDSLGTLELRTHIESQTGIRLTPKTIVTYGTPRALAGHLTETLDGTG